MDTQSSDPRSQNSGQHTVQDLVQVHVTFITTRTELMYDEHVLRKMLRYFSQPRYVVIKQKVVDENGFSQYGYAFAAFATLEEAMHVIERLKGVEVDGVRYDCELSHRTQRKLEKEDVSRFATERLHKSHQQASPMPPAALPASVSQQMESRATYSMPASSSMMPMGAMNSMPIMIGGGMSGYAPQPQQLSQHPQHSQQQQHPQQQQPQYPVSMPHMVYSPSPQQFAQYMPGMQFSSSLPPSVLHVPVLSAAPLSPHSHQTHNMLPMTGAAYVMQAYPQHQMPQPFILGGGYSPMSTSSSASSNYGGSSPYYSNSNVDPLSRYPPAGVHVIEDQYQPAKKVMKTNYHS